MTRPVATPRSANFALAYNRPAAASSLFSASDADGDAITQYEFWDSGAGGGHFRVNGVNQAAGVAIPVSAANLALTDYQGGASAGSELVWVRANDGSGWGAWASWNMTTP